MYLVSPLVNTLFKALHIFSDGLLEVNACLALCWAVICENLASIMLNEGWWFVGKGSW